MKTNDFLRKVALVLSIFCSFTISAQKQAKLIPSFSSVTIKGTSSLHDWEEKGICGLFDEPRSGRPRKQ